MQSVDVRDQAAKAAAKSYMGEFAWPTVILGFTVTLGYLATPILTLNGLMPIWLAVPLMIVLTYASYTIMHEAAHGSITGSKTSMRWLNEMLGYMAGWVLMIPMTAHRHEHLAHHRNTNNSETDPDYVITDMTRSPFHALRAAYRVAIGQYTFYMRNRWSVAPKSQNQRFCMEIAANIVLRVAIIAQGPWLEGLSLFAFTSLAGIALVMYLFAYIVHRPHEAEGRYVDTSTIFIPGVAGKLVTAMWGFQNYHSIHHLFPRVPFYRYRSLFDEIEGIMTEKRAPIYRLTLFGLQAEAQMDVAQAH